MLWVSLNMGMSAAHCQGNFREFLSVWRVVTLVLAAQWLGPLGGSVLSASDSRLRGCGFHFWPVWSAHMAIGHFLLLALPLPGNNPGASCSPSSVIWYQPNRRVGNGSIWERCGLPHHITELGLQLTAGSGLYKRSWALSPRITELCERALFTMGDWPYLTVNMSAWRTEHSLQQVAGDHRWLLVVPGIESLQKPSRQRWVLPAECNCGLKACTHFAIYELLLLFWTEHIVDKL